MNCSIPLTLTNPSNFAAPANRQVTTAKGCRPVFHQVFCASATARTVVYPDGGYAVAVRLKRRKNPKG